MLKLIGAVMVIAASGLSGLAMAGNYARRPKELRSLRSALQILETEIAYSATCLPDAFMQVSGRCDKTSATLFSGAAAELSNMSGVTASEAWDKALEKYYPGTALKSGDLSILRNLGGSLGISDREDQIKHLRLAMEQISAETLAAEEEAARNVKLWSYLGFLGGLLVVLLLY
ncbi:stage III sporulation protein AB [Pelotomaculum terephthalicicum JT]|uniref:stage III sporulation protein SpoIIIAB n=1 Tax=Pelotomaculum TaxID=191373 RepID=UPI0009CA3C75|nr:MULTISPECIES: stage III sporulation protein SpoIIIAB [Pelotomaculum]MCG9968512.1 stage III sporulation protein AB [Pelotomaculum terephthalicicum JT]OPX85047.1 MAG: stage III sporulation protein SpoAB [Pelotomaculum sp. PtaB.Bin117]OPY62753.1 MAG: stage III sporulation protein SpoAB [Pelotomaculum sp. PtaU1.Bin065]